LGNADDELHAAAVTVSSQLAQAGARVLTTDAILTEVANTFSKTAWRSVARRLIEAVKESVAMQMATVVHVDTALWQRG
jgi:predicted nucleic acid-binding protein